jgi:5-(carboxyamino)imidazole ribonucleotide mutase
MAAALPGVVAAQTPLPVLGVPMETRVMGGMDSLLSMAQMPGGIPVGTLAIGKTGAKNAALLAAAILALSDEGVAGRLDAFRNKQNQAIAEVPAK